MTKEVQCRLLQVNGIGQLQRMNANCDVFDVRMEDSRRQLRSIGSLFGSIANKFSKNRRKVRSQFTTSDSTGESPKGESKLEAEERKVREE